MEVGKKRWSLATAVALCSAVLTICASFWVGSTLVAAGFTAETPIFFATGLSFAIAGAAFIAVVMQKPSPPIRVPAQDEALRRLHRDFLQILNNTSDFIYFKDRDGTMRLCSQTVADITGRATWQEMVGKPYAELYPPELAAQYDREDEQIFLSGTPLLGKLDPYVDQHGNQRWIDTRKWPVFDEDGKKVVGVFGISRDITASKMAIDRERLRNNIFELLSGTGDLPAIMALVVDYVECSAPGLIGSILLLTSDGRHLSVAAAARLPKTFNEAVEGLEIGEGQGSCGTAAFRKQRVIVEDITTDPLWAQYTVQAKAAGIASCWSEPIMTPAGDVLGTFAIYHSAPAAPTAADLELLHQAAGLASIAIVRKRAEEAIWRHANFDTLTDLPNRRLFGDRLEQEARKSARSGLRLALMIVDLDRFKAVNDSLGHSAGDVLLAEVARRMVRCVRDSDTVARIGGDEFAVILPGLRDDAAAEQIADSIAAAVNAPVIIASAVAHVSASIGIAFYEDDVGTLDDLMKKADRAMYRAKGKARNRLADDSAPK